MESRRCARPGDLPTMHRSVAAALAAAALAAAPIALPTAAGAQDYSLSPTYGTVGLNAGFTPDPQSFGIVPGGPVDVSMNINGCFGGIAPAPDLRLQYSAGSFPLAIYVYANVDTTLVVNAPDGSWYCNDDADGLDPEVFFPRPMSGQYDIWVGNFDFTAFGDATLYISEVN
jgi:hypothetical protein